MKRIFHLLILVASLFATTVATTAQELLYNVGFESYFDNREYSEIEAMKSGSGTDFAAVLTPELGLGFDEHHRVFFGAELTKAFGADDDRFFSKIVPMLYYAYDSPSWSATVGLFDRSRMMVGDYSTAFFSQEYLFEDSVVSGLMGRYMKDRSYVEFVCDWEGQPSVTTREKFRLLSSARRWWNMFYVGYNLSITHFAGQLVEEFSNVVDNALINPSVGIEIDGRYRFGASVGYLQSLQRDRSYENVWLSPSMAEIGLRVERWGVTLDERIYIGDDLMPLYGGHTLDDGTVMTYGSDLYTGDIFFRTSDGYYNRAMLSYEKRFCDDNMAIRAAFVTHATSGGLATEQILQLSIGLGGRVYKFKK